MKGDQFVKVDDKLNIHLFYVFVASCFFFSVNLSASVPPSLRSSVCQSLSLTLFLSVPVYMSAYLSLSAALCVCVCVCVCVFNSCGDV